MRKRSKDITKERSSSKKAQDMREESYVFVKYSELMALRRSASDASTALSRVAKYGLDTRSMSLRPEVIEGLSRKLMDTSVIRPSMQSRSKVYEAGESLANMGRILRSIGSHSQGSPNGPIKRSRKR